MIENAMKQLMEENDRIKEAGEAGEDNEEDLFNYDKPVIELADYEEFAEFNEELEEENEDFFNSLLEDDDDGT